MRTIEEFKEEFLSEKCFYWCETLEKTNLVLSVLKYFGIKWHNGDECDFMESEATRITIFKRKRKNSEELYAQRSDMWNPRYSLKVRNENAMYQEFQEIR